MYYENRANKPFASLLPKVAVATAPPTDVAASPPADDGSPGPASPTTAGKSPQATSKNQLKRVKVELSKAEYFDEIIVKRTMLLEHIPNAYDKAFDRAFQTLMLDLSKPQ